MSNHITPLDEVLGRGGLLDRVGFYDVLLPTLLLWLLFYAIIKGLKVFGEDNKIAAIVSLILAIFINAFTGFGAFFASLIAVSSGYMGVALVGLLFILGLFALLNLPTGPQRGWTKLLVAAVAIGIVFLIFRSAGGFTGPFALPDIKIAGAKIPWAIIFTWAVVIGLILLVAWAIGLFGKGRGP